MAKQIGSFRRKTRHLFQKKARQKGKISLRRYLQELAVGDRVILVAEPAIQNTLYHRRFHSKVGVVQGKRGSCYEVQIKDKHQEKLIVIHPIHLRKC